MRAARPRPLSWLIPRPDEPGAALVRRTQVVLIALLVMANALGTAVVTALCIWGFPLPEVSNPGTVWLINLIVIAFGVPVAMFVGSYVGLRKLEPARRAIEADRAPTDEERVVLLRAPLTIARVHLVLWWLGAILFGALNWFFSAELGQRVASTVALGGVTTSALSFLVSERQLRSEAARGLAPNPLDKPVGPGIRGMALIAWAVGTGIPGIGLVLVAVSTLIERDFTASELAVAVLALAAVALVFGLYVYRLATRAVADPVLSVRDAMGAVERGELDVEVPVLRRQRGGAPAGRIQPDGGRPARTGADPRPLRAPGRRGGGACRARAGVELGGETRTVAILFCDGVGSTRIAAARDPHEVVEMLNAFFAIVVEVVGEHGGWVNKFEGDAALAIFGAPVEVDDPAGRALAAARELSARLTEDLDDLEAAVGVSYGDVVAGNVGEERRFEYTVIATRSTRRHGSRSSRRATRRWSSPRPRRSTPRRSGRPRAGSSARRPSFEAAPARRISHARPTDERRPTARRGSRSRGSPARQEFSTPAATSRVASLTGRGSRARRHRFLVEELRQPLDAVASSTWWPSNRSARSSELRTSGARRPPRRRCTRRSGLDGDDLEVLAREHKCVLIDVVALEQLDEIVVEGLLAVGADSRERHLHWAEPGPEHLDPVLRGAEALGHVAALGPQLRDPLAEKLMQVLLGSPQRRRGDPRRQRRMTRHRPEHLPDESLRCPVRHPDPPARAAGAQQLVRGSLMVGREHRAVGREHNVKLAVRERHLLCVSLDELDLEPFGRGALTAALEQLGDVVESDDRFPCPTCRRDRGVPGAAGDVEDPFSCAHVGSLGEQLGGEHHHAADHREVTL